MENISDHTKRKVELEVGTLAYGQVMKLTGVFKDDFPKRYMEKQEKESIKIVAVVLGKHHREVARMFAFKSVVDGVFFYRDYVIKTEGLSVVEVDQEVKLGTFNAKFEAKQLVVIRLGKGDQFMRDTNARNN